MTYLQLMLDNLNTTSGPLKTLTETWLVHSIGRGDTARILEPLLVSLLDPSTARVSVLHCKVISLNKWLCIKTLHFCSVFKTILMSQPAHQSIYGHSSRDIFLTFTPMLLMLPRFIRQLWLFLYSQVLLILDVEAIEYAEIMTVPI